MFHVVLCSPEIAPNCGNIMRLCVNVGATLHLIHPLGFFLDDKKLRRAVCDYSRALDCREHDSFTDCMRAFTGQRCFAFTTKGTRRYDSVKFLPDDVLVFGRESSGLTDAERAHFSEEYCLRIPMVTTHRSINVANAVSIALFEAWRQHDFSDNT